MNEMLIALVNKALESGQAHEYAVSEQGTLIGFAHEVEIYHDKYIVTGTDCSRCDGAHVACVNVERVTTDPAEALENLELVGA